MKNLKTAIADKLPLRSLKWDRFLDLIGKAEETIGHFEAVISSVPHPDKVFSILKIEEALASLRIKKSPLKALSEEDGISIQPYLLALKNATKEIKTHPLSQALLRKIHTDLYKHSKAPKKDVGHFRKRQNWIGREGCKIEKAYYYPPKASVITKELQNWKSYIRYPEKNALVQLAILFAQLLVIHPFMDGNGRVARILTPLFLCKKKLLAHPLFFISSYLREHRPLYFRTLFAISDKKDWEGWIRFFLTALMRQGKKNNEKAEKIVVIYMEMKERLKIYDKPKKIEAILDLLFSNPLLDEKRLSSIDNKIVRELRKAGILKQKKGGAHKKIWIFAPLLNLLKA